MNDFYNRLIVDSKKRRIFNILAAFEKNKSLSAVELATKAKATNRTIISDIASIRQEMTECIQIESTNIGYTFKV